MAGLVHKGAAVELPGPAPAITLVVVRLRTGPEDIEMDHMDLAEAFFGDSALEQL